MLVTGKALVFGDHVDTDCIYPSAYLGCFDPEAMAEHAMEGCDPGFTKRVERGGVLVAGKIFGIGSAREQAAACLKYSGLGCVVAESFARSFFRNAINVGLPVIAVPDGVEFIRDGDQLQVDVDSAVVRNLSTGEQRSGVRLPPLVLEILAAGGAVRYFANLCKQ